MTGNERRLLLALEAVAALAILALKGAELASLSASMGEGERGLAASMEAEAEALAALPSLRKAFAAAKPGPDAALAPGPEAKVDAETCAERMRGICASQGLVVLRYGIDRKASIDAVEFSVEGAPDAIAAALARARSEIPGYALWTLSIRARERAQGATADFVLESGEAGGTLAGALDVSRVAALFGVMPPRAAPARVAAPLEPDTPARRIAYVGELTTAEGVQFFFKDLDSGAVHRLGQGFQGPEGWRFAGRDGNYLLLVVEGRNYRIPQR